MEKAQAAVAVEEELSATEKDLDPNVHNASLHQHPVSIFAHPRPPPNPKNQTWMNIYDGAKCVVPFVLAAKVILVIVAHQIDKNNTGYTIDLVSPLSVYLVKFNSQLVTLFTIVFVIIMSALVHRLALYRFQHGALVSDLEQLQASTSLPSTVIMVFSLRKFTKFSAGLIVVWCFYYLGSQATTREYAYAESAPIQHFPGIVANLTNNLLNMRVDPTNQQQQFRYTFEDADQNLDGQPLVDSSGRPIIPDMSDHLVIRDGMVESKWLDVHPSVSQPSSDIGLQLSVEGTANVVGGNDWGPEKIVGTYSFTTSYFYPNAAHMSSWRTTLILRLSMDTGQPRTFNVWSNWNATYWQQLEVSPILINGSQSGSLAVTCNITRPQVEVGVICTATACSVRKFRYLQQTLEDYVATPFDDDTDATTFINNLFWAYPPDPIESPTGTDFEGFIGFSVWIDNMSPTGFMTSANVSDSLDSVGESLMQYINSFYFLGADQSSSDDPTHDPDFELVNIKGAIYNPQYRISWPWIAADFVSCAILLAAALISFWLRLHTLAPDILGYVSSLTRDNPHLPQHDGGSALDGLTRARLLGDVRIKIGDVGEGGEVGKIGIIQYMSGHSQEHSLKSSRKYI